MRGRIGVSQVFMKTIAWIVERKKVRILRELKNKGIFVQIMAIN